PRRCGGISRGTIPALPRRLREDATMPLVQPKRVTVQEWAATYAGSGPASSADADYAAATPAPRVSGVDFETFYSSAYSVSQMGNWAYVHDPLFNAWAVSVSDGERTCVCLPTEFPWD